VCASASDSSQVLVFQALSPGLETRRAPTGHAARRFFSLFIGRPLCDDRGRCPRRSCAPPGGSAMSERGPLDQPPRAFISYARKDEAFARRLRERLEREEPAIKLWQDRTDMEPGAWWRQITEALDRVKFMILVLTPTSLRSPVVRK